MANWKFADDYATAYPSLGFGLLDFLVFSDHTITPATGPGTFDFTGTLDFTATGNALNVLSQLLGNSVTSLQMSGTITTTDDSFVLALTTSNISGTQLAKMPVFGKYITGVMVILNNTTANPTTTVPEPENVDDFSLNLAFMDNGGGKVAGNLIVQIPMSSGLCGLYADFNNLSIDLSDLDFLLPSGEFSSYFPSDNPFVNKCLNESFNLLSIGLSLYVGLDTNNTLSFAVSTLTVTVGIINIPVPYNRQYPNALFLNPLAVSVSLSNFTGVLEKVWAIEGTLALYPSNCQTDPPSVIPDFTFDVGMSLPILGNPFSIGGYFENPTKLPVSTMLQDLFGPKTDIGITKDITITQFDFDASTDSKSGSISSFSMDVGMSDSFGQFRNFNLEGFNVSVAYSK